jgi:hypothetical protein
MDLKKILEQQHIEADAEFDQAVQRLKQKIHVAFLLGKTPEEVVDAPDMVDAIAAIVTEYKRRGELPPEGVSLEGKTVGDLPPMFRDRLLDGGFDEEKLVLEIPTSEIYNCLGSVVRPRGLA